MPHLVGVFERSRAGDVPIVGPGDDEYPTMSVRNVPGQIYLGGTAEPASDARGWVTAVGWMGRGSPAAEAAPEAPSPKPTGQARYPSNDLLAAPLRSP